MTDNKDFTYSYTDGSNIVLMDRDYEEHTSRSTCWATRRRSCKTR